MAQILPRPEGTLPYPQSTGEQLFTALIGGIGKYQRGKRDRQIREAIRKEMGEKIPTRTKMGSILDALFGQPPLSKTEEKLYPTIMKEKIKARYKTPTKREGITQYGIDKIKGALEAGYYMHPVTNQRLTIKTRKQAERWIKLQGYRNYQEDPETVELLNRYPETMEPQKKKGLFLGGEKKTIKSADARFNVLVKQGLTEDQAYRQLIKEGY